MSPDQFLSSIRSRGPEPVYLFLGPERYTRGQCRRALIDKVLPESDREEGFTRHALDDMSLPEVLDDARTLSLFARERVIWAGSAEAVLPRDSGAQAPAAEIEEYLASPVPGVVLVFDCTRFDFEGDDKSRIQRVQKFYAPIKAQVEFPHLDAFAARKLAKSLAKEAKLNIGDSELDLLVDVLDSDATCIATELEKLALYSGGERRITEADIWALVPNAQATTIFALVAALGRGDRTGSLEALDMLTKAGEYLPLALTFLAGQFRMALSAREAGLTSAAQIESHFRKLGVPIWRARAEQISQTVSAFPAERLRAAVQGIYETDKALRDTRPDDKTVMERFVLSLT
jgi:DNA polymerase III subunit delta